MNKKVETILQIASLDKKENEFRFEKVSLHTIIEHSIETIDIQVRNREHHIQVCNCDTCAWVRSTRYFLANHRSNAMPDSTVAHR